MTSQYAHPEFLISPVQLNERLTDPDIVVLDVTTTLIPDGNEKGGFTLLSGLNEFQKGHIPGAQYLHLENDFSTPQKGLLFTLPSVEQFADAATRFGIGTNSFVVVYSTAQPGWAARVWLMLRAFGFTNAAILNGGFSAWKGSGYKVETGTARTALPADRPFIWQDRTKDYFVATDEVVTAISEKNNLKLINALPADAFNGTASIHYGRPGHIPTSLNIPTGSLVGTDGSYLAADDLAALFKDSKIEAHDSIITYCGAGVAGSNVAFAHMLIGGNNAKVYDGSMLEWTQDPSRPVVVK